MSSLKIRCNIFIKFTFNGLLNNIVQHQKVSTFV